MVTKLTHKQFEENMRKIIQAAPIQTNESYAEQYERIERAKSDYAFFFEYYFPHYAKSKCSWFHIFCANLLLKHSIIRLLLNWFRGAAKSVHANIGYPMWLKIHGELRFMVLVGQNEIKAQILLSDIQAEMMSNPRYKQDYGEQYLHGSWETGNFKTKDGCRFYAMGFGQDPRGLRNENERPDYISIDDVDTLEMSKNPARVRKGIDYVCDGLMGCFDIGRQRMVVSNNTPFTHSIIGYLIDEKLKTGVTVPIVKIKKGIKAAGAFIYKVRDHWHNLQVNAVDENFNPAWEEKYTKEFWLTMHADKSMRSWLREYMNTAVIEGSVFKNDWLTFKDTLPYKQYDHLLCYFDPSYKATNTSDYKAIALVGKKGTEYHILKAFVRKCSISAAVKYMYDLNDEIQKNSTNIICNFWMEANYIQDLFLMEFREEGNNRGYQLAIRGDKRAKPDKFSRIENMSPLFERAHIFFSEREENNEDMKRGMEQFLAFEQGAKAHDDFPDAVEGAVFLLNRKSSTSAFEPVTGSYERVSSY